MTLDNIKIRFYRGKLLEENHYYPFGMAVRMSQDIQVEKNKNLYQTKEFNLVANLNTYDLHARQYDPLLARFNSIDPAGQFASGYVGMGNNPTNSIDPDGRTVNGLSAGSYSARTDRNRTNRLANEASDKLQIEALLRFQQSQMRASIEVDLLSSGDPISANVVFNMLEARSAIFQINRMIMELENESFLQELLAQNTSTFDKMKSADNSGKEGGTTVPDIEPPIIKPDVDSPSGEDYKMNDPVKEFIAIVVGESSNNEFEAAGIGDVMLNRLNYKGEPLEDGFVNVIGGKEQFDAIGGSIYNSIMRSSWDEILSHSNPYAIRISGAILSLIVPDYDFSNGAYFWNATRQYTHPHLYGGTIGFNWRMFDRGVFIITTTLGSSTFFRYSNSSLIWP